MSEQEMPSAPTRSLGWRLAHSLWLVVIVLSLGLLSWAAFLYLGAVTRYRRWIAWAVCYLVVAVVSFSLLVAGGSSNSTAEAIVGTLLLLGLWAGSSFHGVLVRKEALSRLSIGSELRRRRAHDLERELVERLQTQRSCTRPHVESADDSSSSPANRTAADAQVQLPPVAAAPRPQPAGTPRTAAPSEPRVRGLIGGVVGGVVFGVGAFIGVLTLVALGGGSYNHYLYPHDYQVIVWIGGVAAVVAVVAMALRWLMRGHLSLRRLGLAGAASATALAGVGLASLWANGQGGSDPRPTNLVRPSVSGIPHVGERLKAHPGIWRWPKDVPAATHTRRFSYRWERCGATALRCDPIRGATSAQYLVVQDDASNRVRVSVTAVNDAGSHEMRSEPRWQ
jgi:hypothetical protein